MFISHQVSLDSTMEVSGKLAHWRIYKSFQP